ncbi:hypothetical protein OIU74_026698 [Salix koriyanagi]|uniref:Uncharacterized protein n=1 Tax=Salix koriyanagi TaxID=2511006 RepID=A0A9Q0VYU0_9ROSI|nr:hypothetical protein OIU74_026698 [Salix koriyanagi]
MIKMGNGIMLAQNYRSMGSIYITIKCKGSTKWDYSTSAFGTTFSFSGAALLPLSASFICLKISSFSLIAASIFSLTFSKFCLSLSMPLLFPFSLDFLFLLLFSFSFFFLLTFS